jgi:Mn2+/Fe2+ NRAMP family transporter
VIAGGLILLTGVDPLKLTVISMALTAATLPLAIVPFIILMNDERYVGKHRNGWISNGVVIFVIGLAFVLAIVAIPLQIMGG